MPEPVVGQKLKSRYLLDERIGTGGMGIVFSATDLEAIRLGHSSSKVAIKVLTPELRSQEAALFDEVQKTRQLQQENIVDVYGFEPDESGGFMVMELLRGMPLDRFVASSWPEGAPLPVALHYIQGMGAALTYAHQRGVIHSDFKPSNVIITGTGIKVLDFGIARAAREAEPTAPRQKPTGVTPEFASCEMLEELPADKRDDVFCFGLVVYFLLTGRHPFNGFPATQARDMGLPFLPIQQLGKRQNEALQRALCFDRDQRSPSVQELVDELHKKTPSPAGVRAAGAIVLVLAAAALGYLYRDSNVPRDSDRQLLHTLCHSSPRALHPLSAQATQRVARLLARGDSYLRIGQDPSDPPGILSENLSFALGAFQSALALAPHHCDAAAEGVLKVATAYKDEAWRLYDEGQYRKAARTAAIALSIWKDSNEMRELIQKVARHLPADSQP